jgi:hypothetical protein
MSPALYHNQLVRLGLSCVLKHETADFRLFVALGALLTRARGLQPYQVV